MVHTINSGRQVDSSKFQANLVYQQAPGQPTLHRDRFHTTKVNRVSLWHELPYNVLCASGWHWTLSNPPASAFQVLGVQTTPTLNSFFNSKNSEFGKIIQWVKWLILKHEGLFKPKPENFGFSERLSQKIRWEAREKDTWSLSTPVHTGTHHTHTQIKTQKGILRSHLKLYIQMYIFII